MVKNYDIFSRHYKYAQDTLLIFKRHSRLERGVLDNRLERGVLENRLEKRPIFFQDGSPRHLSRHLFNGFQDAGVLENRLERCLDSIAS